MKPIEPTIHYYAPIPYYNGKVLKYQGMASEENRQWMPEKHPGLIELAEYKATASPPTRTSCSPTADTNPAKAGFLLSSIGKCRASPRHALPIIWSMQDLYARILSAAHAGAHGLNNKPLPTKAQHDAGNYAVGKVTIHGLPISIEQPRNSFREGVDPDGTHWRTRLAAEYGYIRGVRGADGDNIDVFIGLVPEGQNVYVINQVSPKTGVFDEHKLMIGFLDEADARRSYLESYSRDWKGLGSIIPCTIEQLRWWLKNGDTTKPMTANSLPYDGNSEMTQWDENANPIGNDTAGLIYNLRREDGDGLLLDAVSVADILEDSDGVETLDALIAPFSQIQRKMTVLQSVMEAAGGNVKPLAMQVTEPFKQRGTTNVAAVFELSDGQTVSIFFHNPDTTPQKIKPTDDLISWKWMLNKKDITLLVAPEMGKDLNVREVARRIMRLAEKNSSRFVQANRDRAARLADIEVLKTTVQTKEAELTALEAEEADLQAQLAAKRAAPAVDPVAREEVPPAQEFTIEQVGEAKKQTGAGSVWYGKPAINDPINYGVSRGWLLRPSTTQVEWTQAGVDLLQATKEAAKPEPAGDDGEAVPDGRENVVKTAKGNKVVTGFKVVEAARLIVSHDSDGNENPDYPMELQPRDRARATSIAWVKKTAANLDPESLGRTTRADTGAPIIGKDYVVESGNGRTMDIIEAYRTGTADEYRNWLIEEADYFKVSVERINAMKRPVLVRVRTSDIDRRAFAVEANQDDKLAMTATEKARADAKRLNDELVSRMGESGDLLAAENNAFLAGFLRSLGDAEAAQYVTSNGKPTSSLVSRVQAAIFAKAYNDDRLLELTADAAKPEIANVISALNSAAPNFIRAMEANRIGTEDAAEKLVDSVELSLNKQAVEAVIGAINVVKSARDNGMDVSEFVRQQGLFGDTDPNVAAMAVFIANNNRSAKRLGTAFRAMAEYIRTESEHSQTEDMFGDGAQASLADVIGAANRALDKEFGEGEFAIGTPGLFDAPPENAPAEPVADPQRAADIELMQSIIDHKADMMNPELAGDLEAVYARAENDSELMGMFNRAAQAYSDFMVQSARAALA